jgi:hypothetical protein
VIPARGEVRVVSEPPERVYDPRDRPDPGRGQTPDGDPYIVLEYVGGEPLDRRIQRGPLEIEPVIAIARRVAAALDAARGKGLAHRDIKPANISDVVIAFAALDDRLAADGRQGWISQFHRNLELRVAQLAGASVRVIKQPDPSMRAELEPLVLEHGGDAKTIVSVL